MAHDFQLLQIVFFPFAGSWHLDLREIILEDLVKNLLSHKISGHPERQEAIGVHPGDTHSPGTCFGKFLLPEHWSLQLPFWNPPYSLSSLVWAQPASLPASVMEHLRPCGLLGWDVDPPTSKLAALGPSESPATLNQPSLSVSQHLLGHSKALQAETSGSSSACTSSRTSRATAPSTSELMPASELACDRNQRLRHLPSLKVEGPQSHLSEADTSSVTPFSPPPIPAASNSRTNLSLLSSWCQPQIHGHCHAQQGADNSSRMTTAQNPAVLGTVPTNQQANTTLQGLEARDAQMWLCLPVGQCWLQHTLNPSVSHHWLCPHSPAG